ncbi:TipAS antibiotic-recognition domain-containing protein [Acidobacteriota bacterium]
MEKYYTAEQLNKLKQRKEMSGEEKIQNAESEWKELFKKYKKEMEKGTDPADEPVQKLAKRSQELIAAFTGGDPGIKKSLGRMYQQEGGPEVMAQKGVQLDPKVWEYMGKTMSVLKKSLSL